MGTMTEQEARYARREREYREEPEDQEAHPRRARREPAEEPEDVTLGMPALLGIFLLVVVACAVFFGFGYSTGRVQRGQATPAATQARAASSTGESLIGESLTGASPAGGAPRLAAAAPVAAKPLPGTTAETSPDGLDQPRPAPLPAAEANTRPIEDAGGLNRSPDTARQDRRSLAEPKMSVDSAAPVPSEAVSSAAPAKTGVMVQIAALARRGDAEALASALHRQGYGAVVRTESQDTFLHVQVGPFATKDEARAMRSRLQADGYNAFMKP